MKTILIVDDEKAFLLSLVDGLKTVATDFRILTADNGKDAMGLLETEKVNLIVTDLKMPVMDGFELMAHINSHHPETPVIVMTMFGTPEIENRVRGMGSLQYIEKPIDLDSLVGLINQVLNASARGYVQGIGLATFVQLLGMERKTCALHVRSAAGMGRLYFQEGELVDAVTQQHQGEPAVHQMVCWDEVEIELGALPADVERRIDSSIENLLLEAFTQKDETERDIQRQSNQKNHGNTVSEDDNRTLSDQGNVFDIQMRHGRGADGAPAQNNHKEVDTMSVQEKLKEFTSVDGFAGVAVFTPAGELLAMLGSDRINLKDIGVLANNVLMNAQKASLDMGMGKGQLVHVESEQGSTLVRCLNEGTNPLKSQPGKAHIHVVLVLNSESSLGMAKLKLNKLIGELADDFRI